MRRRTPSCAPHWNSGDGLAVRIRLARGLAARLLRRRLHRLDRRDGGAHRRRRADGAVPRRRRAPGLLARFPGARCVGIAGTSRGRDPAWMDRELPGAFAALAALGAPILHYKVCSTFDSSPANRLDRPGDRPGRAADAGANGRRWSSARRGCSATRLSATSSPRADGVGHRLDRHPTMSRHPVTPMDEADLRRHLAAQTTRRIELVDLVQLRAGDRRGARRGLVRCRRSGGFDRRSRRRDAARRREA